MSPLPRSRSSAAPLSAGRAVATKANSPDGDCSDASTDRVPGPSSSVSSSVSSGFGGASSARVAPESTSAFRKASTTCVGEDDEVNDCTRVDFDAFKEDFFRPRVLGSVATVDETPVSKNHLSFITSVNVARFWGSATNNESMRTLTPSEKCACVKRLREHRIHWKRSERPRTRKRDHPRPSFLETSRVDGVKGTPRPRRVRELGPLDLIK